MNKQKPEESFNIREAKGDDFYKIMVVNEALKNYKDKSHFPWFLLITLDMKNTLEPYNLPNEEESKILNVIEDNLTSLINELVPYQYIGRITDNGKRELYYYLESPQEIHEKLNILIEKDDYLRDFEYEISQDPNWENVFYFFDY
jgi:hypothetical protein